MSDINSIKPFEGKRIRTAWDEEHQEWYFSIVDVIEALTDSPNPTDYLKKMRKRDIICRKLRGDKLSPDGHADTYWKNEKTLAANTEQLFSAFSDIRPPIRVVVGFIQCLVAG